MRARDGIAIVELEFIERVKRTCLKGVGWNRIKEGMNGRMDGRMIVGRPWK